jgi:hypothetical protein
VYVGEFLCKYSIVLKTMSGCGGDRVGIGVQPEPVRTVDQELNIHNSTLKMEASCTSETSATWPTSTRCKKSTEHTLSGYHILNFYA